MKQFKAGVKRVLPQRKARAEDQDNPIQPSPRKSLPFGIKALFVPDVATIDIVFVHGLTGDRDMTWTARDASDPWPKILLPIVLPEARVLTFGYDAYVTEWRSLVSQSRIANHAWSLLTSLASYRENDGTNERSIIFVCHSLGGLVCEDALVTSRQRPEPHLQNILHSTRGIIFLGTPHHGAGLARWAELVARSIGLVKQTNSDVLAVLKRDSEVLARIQDGFHTMVKARGMENQRPIEISCFFEEIPLPGIGLVVPQDSAILPGYILIGIHGNHMEMTRFAEIDNPGFLAVCGELRRWIRDTGSCRQVTLPSEVTVDDTASGANQHGSNKRQYNALGAAVQKNVDKHDFEAEGGQNFGMVPPKDAIGRGLAPAKTSVSTYEQGVEINGDMLEEKTFLAGKCFARCPRASMDTKNKQPPIEWRFAKFPCPGVKCDSSIACEWICRQCMWPWGFGYTDTYMYCDCGRAQYDQFEFKCNGHGHGPGYKHYRSDKLLALLKGLQKDSFTILILGETGVGKSTFINAFVNYLTFETLEQAKQEKELNWIIPCSFDLQIMDRSRSDGQIKQVKINVGKGTRDDEKDVSKGDSATQEIIVYPVTIATPTGTLTIRLIDTPGIGATRGLRKDKENMMDILNTLSSYYDLHGVLILLKANNARLDSSFRFYVKELLTHLHKSAADNMVFGFTNTRISNYTPGDTYGPLSTLLAEHPDSGLQLNMTTAYCFDSESFRFLAAFKNGHTLPNEEDFRRSWEHSRAEAWRLVDHFRTLTPHVVKSTISLNGARRLIQELIGPMAEISQVIRVNIAIMQDTVQELKDTRLANATDIQKRQASLAQAQQLVKEYLVEHEKFQTATAQFVLFLKARSMTANDPTADYLNMRISDEEAKVQIGGGDKRLQSLLSDLRQHEELVKTMAISVQDNKRVGRADGVLTESGVDTLVRQLYRLPHFGKELEKLKDAISFEHAATYRERPYRVQARGSSYSS